MNIDIIKGDILLGGRFKNQRLKVKSLGTDDLGQPTVNKRKLLSYRIEKTLPEDKKSSVTRGMNKQALDNIYQAAFDDELEKIAKKLSRAKKKWNRLQSNKTPLSPEERALVMKRKAVWHHGPNGEETPAVWKSVDKKTNQSKYITNTHRAYQAEGSLKAAINKYHSFIKGTA